MTTFKKIRDTKYYLKR